MSKLRLAILKNEIADDHLRWVEVCRERTDQVEWTVIDLTRADWLEQTLRYQPDGLLAKPSGFTMPFKTLYDERLTILHTICKLPVYPSLEEIQIYENKKYLSYWLAANQIPHPTTRVFYDEAEALDFAKTAQLPLVGKLNIGASGRGVTILKTAAAVEDYIKNIFSGKGASQQVGPKWKKKGFVGRVVRKLLHPAELKTKLNLYRHARANVQKDFVLLQEFIPHSYEWRCVRIGDSYFAHKKMVVGEKASGSLVKGYDTPSTALLDFVKAVTDRRGFWSQSVDLFETTDGQFLVNEMQCIFGQSDPYQMAIDGQPGRYVYQNDEWVFEAGDFNRYESYLLRLDHFIEILTHQEVLQG